MPPIPSQRGILLDEDPSLSDQGQFLDLPARHNGALCV